MYIIKMNQPVYDVHIQIIDNWIHGSLHISKQKNTIKIDELDLEDKFVAGWHHFMQCNYKKAYLVWRNAVKNKIYTADFGLGLLFLCNISRKNKNDLEFQDSQECKRYIAIAIKYMRRCIKHNMWHAYIPLYRIYRILLKRPNKAAQMLYQAIKHDVNISYSLLSLEYIKCTIVKKNKALLAELTHIAADNGYTSECCATGIYYLKGWYFQQNIELGVQYLEKAMNAGHAFSCYVLGTIYLEGVYVERNISKAVELLQEAVCRKSTDAIKELSMLYIRGAGVEKNIIKAIQLRLRKCYKPSANYLNEYFDGLVPREVVDYVREHDDLKKKCEELERQNTELMHSPYPGPAYLAAQREFEALAN
jgi:TPR repeat protein